MSKISLSILIVCLLATIGALVYIRNPRPYKIAWANLLYDQRQHYIPCEDLPFYPQVQKTLSQHQDMVDKLKAAGATEVSAQSIKCPAFQEGNYFVKGDIQIDYGTRQQRKAIEQLLGDSFFGVPYRGYDR